MRFVEGNLLKDKRILLCVSGGIAVYKALELLRFLKKRGAEVKVAMSKEACRFVAPLSFEVLSGHPILLEEQDWERGVDHISYGSWAELCILAPATINSLCKFAYGMVDNAMLSALLASQAPKIIAPAANTQMLLSPQAQEAKQKLLQMGCVWVEPREDLLACGTQGVGALREVEEIGFVAMRELLGDGFWRGKKILLSGGGSRESIDAVRCISNDSSGLQARCFALALYLLGAEVVFVSSLPAPDLPSSVLCKKALSTQDFYLALSAELEGAEYYFGIAALSDFAPSQKREGKIKREQGLSVEFVENLDVLKSLQGIKKIGFKAEKDAKKAKEYAQKMLHEKDCEWVCLNILGEENGFGSERNALNLLGKGGQDIALGLQSKLSLAFAVLEEIKKEACKNQ